MVSTYSTLPATARCTKCGIGVASGETEARAISIPFAPLVNLRVGDLCIGCAGGDERQRIDELAAGIEPPGESDMKGKPVTDEQIAKVWEKVIDGRTDPDCVREAAERIGVGHATLTLRLRKLGLAYPRRVLAGAAQAGVDGRVAEPLPLPVVDLRQPYERPSVATLPLNGDDPTRLGKHANGTAAQDVGAQTHQETAVDATPPIPPNLLAFLADMERLGGRVKISGKVGINIEIDF